ncbi:DUF4118 domain-containing protein [Dactylosporangium sp. CA-092794]|uniref:sensor histidine kinase n=1 Tax=Dactylosporangium sp. CA-092794 TaxID=3239929 RepID=UPI003D91C46D
MRPPPFAAGLLAAAVLVTVETLALYALHGTEHRDARGVVYLFGVLVVSTVWGAGLGILTSLASALAYNYFHVAPFGVLNLTAGEDLEDTVIFVIAAMLVSGLADLARSYALEVTQRRREADLSAELAHLLLGARDLRPALRAAARRIAQTLELPSAAIELDEVGGGAGRVAFPLRAGDSVVGTLLVPAGVAERIEQRLRQWLVPTLESLLSAARERATMTDSLMASRERARLLADQQVALRRVATLVARGAAPAEVFEAVTDELARVLGPYPTGLYRCEPDGTFTQVTGRGELDVGRRRYPAVGDSILVTVRRTCAPGRMSYEHAAGPNADRARRAGLRSTVGAPVIVEGRVWGVAIVASTRPEPLPGDTETRLADFTELVGTAIANAESHAELTASRARIVAAGDEARRRIERDLHDGAQQQLIALGLRLRMLETTLPAGLGPARTELSQVVDGLTGIFQDLQQISRGIHPGILAEGGLGPALRTLARRSPVPVDLTLAVDRRLPDPVEVAAYYVVSEALTNTAKHARASRVRVDVEAGDTSLRIRVHDNGVGGADTDRGSGLIGLRDRIAAVGGHLDIVSPAGIGTTLLAEIPVAALDGQRPRIRTARG